MIIEAHDTTTQLLAELDAQRRRIAELEAERAVWQTRDTQFRLIFDNAAIGIALVDLTGKPLQVNPALQRMLGYSAEELRGMTFAQFTHPDDITTDWSLFQETIAGRRDSYQIEKRYLRRDGSVMWGRLSVSMLRTPNGDADYVLSVVEDITERKRAEAVLRQSEEHYRLLFEEANDLIFIHPLMTGAVFQPFLEVNRRACEALGYSRDELCRLTPSDIVADIDLAVMQQAEMRLAADRQLLFERGLKTKDGRVLATEIHAHVFDLHGQPMVLSVVRDITERAAAQRALQRRAAQLSLLNDVGRQIASAHMVDEVLNRAAQLIHRELGYHHVGIFTIDAGSGELVMRARAGGFTHLFAPDHRLPPGQGMVGGVAQHGQSQLANDVNTEPHYVNLYGDALPTRSELTVPIKIGERVLGVLDVQSPQRDAFMPEDRQVQETLADQIAVALENARLFEAAQRELAERTQAEAALRDREALLNATGSLARVGGWALDTESLTITWTDETYRIHDLPIGSPPPLADAINFYHPDDRPTLQAAIERALAHGEPYDLELRFITATGRPLWVRTICTPQIQDGRVTRLLGAFQDITDRKQIEESLRDQQELAGALRDTAATLNRTLDIDELFDRILENVERVVAHDSANIMLIDGTPPMARVARLRGYAAAVEIERLGSLCLPIDETANLRRMRETGRPIVVPDTHLDPDWVELADVIRSPVPGSERLVRSYVGAPITIRGQVVGFINLNSHRPYFFTLSHGQRLKAFADQAAIAIDNARLFEAQQRRLNEQTSLLKATTALGSSLEIDLILDALAGHLGTALDVTSTYICSWDSATNRSVVLAQWAGERAAPGERQACVGETYDLVTDFGDDLDQWLIPGLPFISQVDDPQLYEPARQHMLQFGGQSALTVPLVVQGRSIGYVDLWESRRKRLFTPAEIALAQGIAQQAAAAMENARLYAEVRRHAVELEERVAERTRELTEANARLAELDHLKDDFISRISHELRTPLTSLKIFIELMEHGKPEKQARYRQVIRESADKLHRLIEDLFKISDLDMNRLPVDFQPIDLNQLVRDQITTHSSAAAIRELTLTADPAGELPRALGDPLLLMQAISNIMVNAINYTPRHGVITLRTARHSDSDGDWLTLTVEDNGPGIPAEDLPHLFDRFYRGSAARDFTTSGVGVGLSISRTVVERLGGRITVRNLPTGGAAFTVWLKAAVNGQGAA